MQMVFRLGSGRNNKIPLPRNTCSDRWAWHHTKHGDFAVRSAYFIELHSNKRDTASTSVSRPSGTWKCPAPNKG